MNKSIYILLFTILIASTSCTKDFETINTNPNEADNLDPKLQLSYVLNQPASDSYSQQRGNLIYCSIWSQQLSGPWDTDRYLTTFEEYVSAWWNYSYLNVGKDLQDIINKTEEGTNIHSIATIFKVFFFQRLTDMYGDIPYSEANQGSVFALPVYDTQEAIYQSFVDDLTKAIANLDVNTDGVGSADILFNGDMNKWRKFGNSVLLRVAMRMSNANPELAKSVGKMAIEGGLMTSNDDIAMITFTGSSLSGPNANGISEVFQNQGISAHMMRYSDEFVNYIINNDDPREDILIETYTSEDEIDNNVGSGNHLGRPNGIDPGNDDFVFAQPTRDIIVTHNAPAIYMSFAEVEFLRAEAIVKGWVSGNAQSAYENGVFAACKHLSFYPNAPEISDGDIIDYLEENDVEWDEGDAIELINTQKWIALLFDGFEAYANYRRCGYPEITPGLSDGESNGDVPRRLRYPNGEKVNNEANYNEAVSRLSDGDKITSKMWWDVE